MLTKKAIKLAKLLTSRIMTAGLLKGVAAAVEHRSLLRSIGPRTIVDVGANRGQFALLARALFPHATILSFEPLPLPAKRFRRLFAGDSGVSLHNVAIAAAQGQATMHVSGREDSSSLLPITALQDSLFPGTAEQDTEQVAVAPLDSVVTRADIRSPALLKIDVQGYELEVLRGCESLLSTFAFVYVECSFVELYQGQAFADQVIRYLQDRGFRLEGVYNLAYDRRGLAVQGDFFFRSIAV